MLTRYVALVSEESSITPSELTRVAAALQKQAVRDFGPIWEIEATVDAFTKLEDLPLDYWPIIVKDDIGDPSAAGFHDDEQGQPFSLVQFDRGWHLTASHELVEMLADPFGRRMVAGESPVAGQGRVKFLVEVADPSEDAKFSYTINGIQVSDFYTPRYFDPVRASGVRYSYTGAITSPRQVLKGGYLSWYVPATKKWWQRTWFSGNKPADRTLANLQVQNGNLRNAIDRQTEAERQKALRSGRITAAARKPTATSASFTSRANDLRAAIAAAGRIAKR